MTLQIPHNPLLNQDTPCAFADTTPDYSSVPSQSRNQGELNDSKAITDDDPDFDVMAELEDVNYDDFFDEWRSDRAVRVSKVEAKVCLVSLHSMTLVDWWLIFCAIMQELREDTADFLHDDREIFSFEALIEPPHPLPTHGSGSETRQRRENEIVSYPPLPPPPL